LGSRGALLISFAKTGGAADPRPVRHTRGVELIPGLHSIRIGVSASR
jgi:hypothetical protein